MAGPTSHSRSGHKSRAALRRLPSLRDGRRAVEAQSLTQPSGSRPSKSNVRQEVMEAALDANGDRASDNAGPPGSQGNFPQFPSASALQYDKF